MTIEAILPVEFEKDSFLFNVKMIRIESVSYFFIRDKEDEGGLLSGKTLELTYLNSFLLTEFGGVVKTPGVNKRVQDAIQQAILDDKETWFLPIDPIEKHCS